MSEQRHKHMYRILSLFSGCGGLDFGFVGGFDFFGRHYMDHRAEVVFANDIDKHASKCYNDNIGIGHSLCLTKDIRDIPIDEIPNFDIMTAGFPCQPFSIAGSRKGVKDEHGRGTLFEECERILRGSIERGHKPKAFVFENVKGILSSKLEDGTPVTEEITKRMNALGYKVSIRLLKACDYGVPSTRERVFVVGVSEECPGYDFDKLQDIVREYDIPSVMFGTHRKLMVGNVIQHTEKLTGNEYLPFSPGSQDMINKVGVCKVTAEDLKLFGTDKDTIEDIPDNLKRGRSWKDVPYDLLPARLQNMRDNPKKYRSPVFYRRHNIGEINGTITASATPERCAITHPLENRRYTVREIARIQSFPDTFFFDGIPLKERYKVIGNSVPPVLAWIVSEQLIRTIC